MLSIICRKDSGRGSFVFCWRLALACAFLGGSLRPSIADEMFPEQRLITSSASCVCMLFPIDVNGDRKIDILSASFGDSQIAWYENDGQNPSGFIKHIITKDLGGSLWICGADLDGDGDTDVIASERDSNRICWYENSGGKSPTFTRHIITTAAIGAVGVCAMDMDGDGRIDIVSSSDTENTIAWYRNDGQSPPNFSRIIVSRNYLFPLGIDIQDIDGDGRPDIVAAFQQSNLFAWFKNDGQANPTFTPYTIATGFSYATFVRTGDINSDGKMDIVGCSSLDNKIAWFENSGGINPTFTTHMINSNAPANPGNLYVADLNLDGNLDIISSSVGGGKFYWYENNGGPNPTFTSHLLGTGNGAAAVISADFNSDGLPDIATSAMYDYSIYWYPNKMLLPAVQVLTPQGGDIFEGDTDIPVSWKTDISRAGTAVKMELWNNSGWVADLGACWNPQGAAISQVYLPLVPERADYWIRAVSSWDPSLSGQSTGTFAISGGPIRLYRPQPGETWQSGTFQTIEWKSNPNISGTAIGLELWRNGVKKTDLAEDWSSDGHGYAVIKVPSLPPGAGYKIRAVSLWDSCWWRESDGTFNIKNDQYHNAVPAEDWSCYR